MCRSQKYNPANSLMVLAKVVWFLLLEIDNIQGIKLKMSIPLISINQSSLKLDFLPSFWSSFYFLEHFHWEKMKSLNQIAINFSWMPTVRSKPRLKNAKGIFNV